MLVFSKTDKDAVRHVKSTADGFETWKPWAPGVGTNSRLPRVSWG
jgi:hypothetical protein